MSRKSDAAERGREAYARWKELSEDEKNEDLRRRLLASDQNNPVVRDMLKTVEKDIRGRSWRMVVRLWSMRVMVCLR